MIYRFGEFALDTDSCEIRRIDRPIALQPRVFDLLAYLVEHAGRLIPKAELFERVWGGVAVCEASLSQAAKHARRALGDDAAKPSFIVTIRGRGYRFVGPVTRELEPPVEVSLPARADARPPRRSASMWTLAGAGFRARFRLDAAWRTPHPRPRRAR